MRNGKREFFESVLLLLRMRMVELWCNVLGSPGGAFLVSIAHDECVAQLKDAIKTKIPHEVDRPSLSLFLAKQNGKWLTEEEANALRTADGLIALRAQQTLWKMGLSENDLAKCDVQDAVHVMVVAPRVRAIEYVDQRMCKLSPLEVLLKKSWKPSELPKKGAFLSLFEWSGNDIGTIKDIAVIHDIVDFTGPSFYVRKEVLCVLENFTKINGQELNGSRESSKRFILVGSTGMGKSCILALLCFFIAVKCNRTVVWHLRVRSGRYQTATRLIYNEKRYKWKYSGGKVYNQLYHIFGAGALDETRYWFCLDGVSQDMMIKSK